MGGIRFWFKLKDFAGGITEVNDRTDLEYLRENIMGMEEFLCKLLKREIECPIFPDDFILESNNYLKYTYQAPD